MSAPPAQQRRERQRAEARRSILDATESLLVEGGYEHFSMRRLAERCGYTAPTIYHYFRDKPGLLDALLEERFGRLLEQLRRVPRQPDAADTLLELAHAFVRFGLRHPTHYRLLMTPRLGSEDSPRSAEQARAKLEQPLHELAAQGRLRASNVEAVTQTIWATTHGLISLLIHRPDYEWSPGLVDLALDSMIHGLLAAPADAPPRSSDHKETPR